MFTIRREQAGDEAAIAEVVTRAFGQADEAQLTARLRADGDAIVSLVAEAEGLIVGHVLLSIMSAPLRALGLAPLSVAPERQKSGIGSALVRAALDAARSGGWEAVFVYGAQDYYRRFGFSAALAAGFESPYAGPHLMAVALSESLPAASGTIGYAPAFDELG